MGGPGSGSKPRKYPPDVVELVCGMYRDGMTVREINAVAPKGYRVQTILERYLPERRPQAKRDQRAEANHMWKGDGAGYKAMHLRVYSERGAPACCTKCGTREASRYEWANLTGNYQDVNDYQRMCVACHRQFDAARRRATGKCTSPARR